MENLCLAYGHIAVDDEGGITDVLCSESEWEGDEAVLETFVCVFSYQGSTA